MSLDSKAPARFDECVFGKLLFIGPFFHRRNRSLLLSPPDFIAWKIIQASAVFFKMIF